MAEKARTPKSFEYQAAKRLGIKKKELKPLFIDDPLRGKSYIGCTQMHAGHQRLHRMCDEDDGFRYTQQAWSLQHEVFERWQKSPYWKTWEMGDIWIWAYGDGRCRIYSTRVVDWLLYPPSDLGRGLERICPMQRALLQLEFTVKLTKKQMTNNDVVDEFNKAAQTPVT